MATAASVQPYVALRRHDEFTDAADRMRAFLSQVCCRHSYIRRATSGRLYLECLHCQRTTRGVVPAQMND
jgi:hypothetical protein